MRIAGIGIICLLVFGGAGCTTDVPEGRLMTDDTGRSVSVPEEPVRVVSLAPSVTELVFAAGGGQRLIAVSDADDFPAATDTLERVQALPLNHERLASLNPDLILASDQINDPRDADALEDLGIPSFFVSIQTLPDVTRAIRMLGFILGTRTAADSVSEALEARLAALDSLRDARTTRATVIFLIGNETLFSFGPESYVHDMIAVAGGRSLTETLDTQAPILSEEFVIDSAPEVIMTAFEADAESLLSAHPSWASVPAVRDGRIHPIPADWVLRPGPRLILGVEAMAKALSDVP